MRKLRPKRRPPLAAAGSRGLTWSLRGPLEGLNIQPVAAVAEPSAEPAVERFADLAGDARRLGKSIRVPCHSSRGPLPTRRVAAPLAKLWVRWDAARVVGVAEGVPARFVDDLAAGRLLPVRQLDLHRLAAAEAKVALTAFVLQARRGAARCVLVVCGRGVHSDAGGPVLPDVAVQHLSERLATHVLAFTTAPRRFGGQGALLLALRDRWPGP